MLKKIGEVMEGVRDYGVSFTVGAVPAFLGTAFLAGAFALSYGIASAVGLPGALSVVAGVIGTALTAGTTAGLGAFAGIAGFLGTAALADKVPVLRDAELKGWGVGLGIVAGMAASAALAFNLASAGEDLQTSSAPSPATDSVVAAEGPYLASPFTMATHGSSREIVLPAQPAAISAPRPFA